MDENPIAQLAENQFIGSEFWRLLDIGRAQAARIAVLEQEVAIKNDEIAKLTGTLSDETSYESVPDDTVRP